MTDFVEYFDIVDFESRTRCLVCGDKMLDSRPYQDEFVFFGKLKDGIESGDIKFICQKMIAHKDNPIFN